MKRWMSRWTWASLVALGVTLGSVQAATAQVALPSDPAAVLIAWEKVAFGSTQDLDAALALMTDDAVVRVIPAPPGTPGSYSGKAAIRQALQHNRQLDVERQNVGTPRVTGNTVTVTSMVSNNFFRMWGVAPVEHVTVAIVEGGKIKSYTSTMAATERARVGAAAMAYQRTHAAPQSMPATGGSTRYGLLAGLLMLGLLCLGSTLLVRRGRRPTS